MSVLNVSLIKTILICRRQIWNLDNKVSLLILKNIIVSSFNIQISFHNYLFWWVIYLNMSLLLSLFCSSFTILFLIIVFLLLFLLSAELINVFIPFLIFFADLETINYISILVVTLTFLNYVTTHFYRKF